MRLPGWKFYERPSKAGARRGKRTFWREIDYSIPHQMTKFQIIDSSLNQGHCNGKATFGTVRKFLYSCSQ